MHEVHDQLAIGIVVGHSKASPRFIVVRFVFSIMHGGERTVKNGNTYHMNNVW